MAFELAKSTAVTIKGTIQYNGDELQDNDVFGELSGLAAEGEIYIKLLAPAELLQAKKGYRAGKPDTPASQPDNEDQQQLREDEPPTDPNHPVNQTPEDAFAAVVTAGQD